MISSKGRSKMSECFQRQSRKNFEFCSHKNCTLTRFKHLNSSSLFVGLFLLPINICLFLSCVGGICIRKLLAEAPEGIPLVNSPSGTPQISLALGAHKIHIFVYVWVQPCTVQREIQGMSRPGIYTYLHVSRALSCPNLIFEYLR